MICVEGRVQVRNYDDKDGNKRYVTEIVVENAEFVGAKKEESSTISKMETDEIKVPQNYESNYEGGNDTSIVLADSDLPF
jgi:single-strand DNA-binding protein